MASNTQVKNELITKYGKICFFKGVLSLKNPLTLHHETPVRQGGITHMSNCSPIGLLQHEMFNAIEIEKPREVKRYNDYLKYYKETRDELARLQASIELEKDFSKIGYEVSESKSGLFLVRKKR